MDEFDVMSDFIISKEIGYGSVHDGEKVNMRLCCACFDRITHACVIDPFIRASSLTDGGGLNAD